MNPIGHLFNDLEEMNDAAQNNIDQMEDMLADTDNEPMIVFGTAQAVAPSSSLDDDRFVAISNYVMEIDRVSTNDDVLDLPRIIDQMIGYRNVQIEFSLTVIPVNDVIMQVPVTLEDALNQLPQTEAAMVTTTI